MADKDRRAGGEKQTNDRKLFVRINEELEEALEAYAERHLWKPSAAARNILVDVLLRKKMPPS